LPKESFPRWYHTLRGFTGGLATGCAGMAMLYEFKIIPADNFVWDQMIFPLLISILPVIVLLPFEIFFGIQRYRAFRRKMDERRNKVLSKMSRQ
jgi:hypothetical protein